MSEEQSIELQNIQLWINDNLELVDRADFHKWRRYYMARYLRLKYKISYSRVGAMLKKDHSSIQHNIKKGYEVLKGFDDFKQTVEDLTYRFPMPDEHNEQRRNDLLIESLQSLEVDVYRKRFNFIVK